VARDVEHVYHQYVVRSDRRESLLSYLAANGIPATVLYPQAVHQQSAYAGRLLLAPGGLPVTESVVAELLCLPVHPQMSDEGVDEVVRVVNEWAGRAA
jgi:dTDP-4-amino-4,6-dideoxygalactose transaminase